MRGLTLINFHGRFNRQIESLDNLRADVKNLPISRDALVTDGAIAAALEDHIKSAQCELNSAILFLEGLIVELED